jgi:UDP-N-acetylglucosamine 2-epimerase (non-hydrolysing)
MKRIAITCVVGARPNFIKMASITEALRSRSEFSMKLVHTGQHHSPEMSQQFFDDLELPRPDISLEVSGGTQTEQTAEIMKRLEKALLEDRPDAVLIVGDVTSTLATALVASKLGIRIAHVEAGLRSFDRRMPEEINRIVTDTLSDYLFVTERSGLQNLKAEGISEARIFFSGNVMIDTLLRFQEKARRSDVLDRLGLQSGGYAVATMHRPSNVDDPQQLAGMIAMLRAIGKELPLVFPVHPRTRKQIEEQNLNVSGLIIAPPLGYLDFLRLMSEARLVLTDSGGIQEETTILQVPCLTMRDNTERPVTIEQGTNRLVGAAPENIIKAAREILNGRPLPGRVPELWDGNAGQRIADVLAVKLTDN